jgi:hypothetical protein
MFDSAPTGSERALLFMEWGVGQPWVDLLSGNELYLQQTRSWHFARIKSCAIP